MIFASPAHMLFLNINVSNSDIAEADSDIIALKGLFIFRAAENTMHDIAAAEIADSFFTGISKQERKVNTDPMTLKNIIDIFIISGMILFPCFFGILSAADIFTAATAADLNSDQLL